MKIKRSGQTLPGRTGLRPGGGMIGARTRGFTLLELLVVLGILGILLALGIPGYVAYQRSLQFQNALLTVSQEFTLATTESLRRNVAHELTFSVGAQGQGEMNLRPASSPSATRTTRLENGAYISEVRRGPTAVTGVNINGRGRPDLTQPLDVTVNLGARSGRVRLLPTGKALIL